MSYMTEWGEWRSSKCVRVRRFFAWRKVTGALADAGILLVAGGVLAVVIYLLKGGF